MDCGSSVDDALYSSSPSPDESRVIALVKQHYFPLLSYAHRRCAVTGAAEAVVSQTFAFARQHIEEVPEGDQTFPWLLRVTRRHMATRRRTDALRQRVLSQLRQTAVSGSAKSSTEGWPPRQSGRLAGGPAGLPIAPVTDGS
jgi:RNA polymerase sigma-70 factor, ECF subfamily